MTGRWAHSALRRLPGRRLLRCRACGYILALAALAFACAAPAVMGQVLERVQVDPEGAGADITVIATAPLPDPAVTITDDGWLVVQFDGVAAFPWTTRSLTEQPLVCDLSIENDGSLSSASCSLIAHLSRMPQCFILRPPDPRQVVLRLVPFEERTAGIRQESLRRKPVVAPGKDAGEETLEEALSEHSNPPPGAERDAGPEPPEPGPLAASPTPVSVGGEGRYTLDTTEEDVGVVLKALARESGTNIVAASGITGKVTLELRDVTIEDALRYITELTDLSYRRDGSTYVVTKAVPSTPPAPERPETVIESYTTSHVGATELAQTVAALFPDEGLIIKPGPQPLTPKLDQAQTSEVTGVTASSLEGAGAGERVDNARTVILRGPRPVVDEALAACRRLDTPRAQVKIEVMVLDVSSDALNELGLTWTWSKLAIREQSTSEGIKFGSFGRETASIDATLSALARTDRARLLARPVVSVLDSGRAFILIGERILYPVLVGYTQAQTPIFDKGEERVGIYMQVAPSIGEDGQITMTIYPQVSVVTDYLEVNGASYPQISTREAQTTVRVRSGDQIVIGGLIQDDEIRSLKRVPGLSRIPLFGELFKWRSKTDRRSEVVIFMRPTLVEDAADTHPSPLEPPGRPEGEP